MACDIATYTHVFVMTQSQVKNEGRYDLTAMCVVVNAAKIPQDRQYYSIVVSRIPEFQELSKHNWAVHVLGSLLCKCLGMRLIASNSDLPILAVLLHCGGEHC